MSNPLAIIGTHRSGSTLLWDVIRHDPAFTHHFCEPLHPYVENEICTAHWFSHQRTIWDQIKDWHRVGQGWYPTERMTAGELDVLRRYLAPHQVENSVTKYTYLTPLAPWFREEFPDTKVVVLVRDPRAAAFSITGYLQNPGDISPARFDFYDRFFFINWTYLERAQYPNYAMGHPPHTYHRVLWSLSHMYRYLWETAQTDNTLVVRYEDFVRDPVEALGPLYGGQVPPEVVERTRTQSRFDAGHWREPVTDERVETWRILPASYWRELLAAHPILEYMEKFGYDHEYPPIPKLVEG